MSEKNKQQLSMYTIVKEVVELKKVAARDPVNFGVTGPAIAVAARQANERIDELTKDYAEIIKKNAVAIFLFGPDDAHVKEFAAISDSDFGTINVDAGQLYSRISQFIAPGIGPQREFGAHQAGQMISALREIGGELKLDALPAPRHPVLPVVLKTDAEVTDYIRRIVRSVMGDDLNRAYLSQQIVSRALNAEYVNPAVPVVIVGAQFEEVPGLSLMFDQPTEVITLIGPITKEVVTKKFTEIKNKLRQGKK